MTDVLRTGARMLLGGFLIAAGIAHLLVPDEFRAQVPPFLPAPEAVVLVSGVVEMLAGAAVLLAPGRVRPWVGVGVGLLFVAVFPGNVSQYVTGTDGFGLDTDGARAVRLLFQPLLVVWALWACGPRAVATVLSSRASPGSGGPGASRRPSP